MTKDDVNQATVLSRNLWERTMSEEISSTLMAESKNLPFRVSRFQVALFFLKEMSTSKFITRNAILDEMDLENMIS